MYLASLRKHLIIKNELVNDLVCQARKQQRQIDWIGCKLELAENSGFTNDSKNKIR